MDVRGVLATKQMKRGLRIAATAGVAFVVLHVVYTVGGKEALATVIAASAAIRLWSLETARLRRLVARRAQDLEQHARALGLTPSVSDPGVHEGVGEHGRVSVRVEDPAMLHDDLTMVILWVLVMVATTRFGVFPLAGVLLGAVLLSVWTSRRPTINVEFVTDTGLLHRMEVHRSSDVKAALAPMPRLGAAGRGALGFSESDDPAGRIAVALPAGALSPREGEE
jgi:hypothetical protein